MLVQLYSRLNQSVSHLADEIGEEFVARRSKSEPTKELLDLALRLVPFFLTHNGEVEAVDLLGELESIASIVPFVDHDTFARVCRYMVSCVNLLPPPDDVEFLKTARQIYLNEKRHTEAIVLSLKLQDFQLVEEDFNSPKNPLVSKPLPSLAIAD